MTTKPEEIVAHVLNALKSNESELPTLPDIALKLRDMLNNEETSVSQVVGLISSDPIISMHVIRAANSAALFRGEPVFNLHDAVVKLGSRLLHGMIMNITLNNLFKAKNPLIARKLTALWEHSHQVAANSYVLARQCPQLKPDTALLIGLVHDIGALPLYLYVDRYFPTIDTETLENLVKVHTSTITPRLLKNWNFPEGLVNVISLHARHEDLGDAKDASYLDVLTMANLHAHDAELILSGNNMLTAERLGFYAEDNRNFLPNHAIQLSAIRNMLRMNPPQPA